MRIHPIENYSDIALDRRQEFLVYALINLILGVVAVVVCIRGYHPITFVVAMLVVIRNTLKCVKKARLEKSKVTDMTQTFVELDDNGIICNQTSEDDAYESCEILYEDINRVFVAKKDEKRGFYIQINDSKKSRIIIDNMPIDSRIFCVNGTGYDDEEWNHFYATFVSNLPPNVEMPERDRSKRWREKTMKEEAINLLAPWIFVLAIGLIHILFAVGLGNL